MQKLAELCIRLPVFASMIVLSLVVIGAASYFQLDIDKHPEVELPTVSIRTNLPGASPGRACPRRASASNAQARGATRLSAASKPPPISSVAPPPNAPAQLRGACRRARGRRRYDSAGWLST